MSEAGTPKEAKQPKAPKQGAGPPESKAAKKKEAAQSKGKGPPVGETARDPNYVPRYKKHYLDAVRPELMKKFGFKSGDFPVCEYVSARTLALPFFGKMTPQKVDHVCDTLEKILDKTLVARKGRF